MKSFINILKAVCAISFAVLLYITGSKAASGGDNILVLIALCVFALATTVLLFVVSSLNERVGNLEDTLGIYVDKGYEPEEIEKKTCKKCSAEIDADYLICPYCGERDDMLAGGGNPYVERIVKNSVEDVCNESLAVDHSDDEIVSANFDFDIGE